MDKRTEIREGIDKEVAIELCLYCQKHDQSNDPCTVEAPCEAALVTARTIRGIYHSQGVVIKVNEIKEITTTASQPETFYAQGGSIAMISTERTNHIYKALKEAGYVAVGPLIEEE